MHLQKNEFTKESFIKESNINFPSASIFDLKIVVIPNLTELKVVEVDIRIFAHNNSPPTPH